MKQAVYTRSNVYTAGARAFAGETGPLTVEHGSAAIVAENDEVHLAIDLPDGIGAGLGPVAGRDLERVRFADAEFEERDGSPAVIDTDLTGTRKQHGHTYPAGPLAALSPGSNRLRIW